MRRKLRRWTACAVIVTAVAASPLVSACGPVKPPRPVIRGVSYSVVVTPLEPRVLSDFER
jgi:hypothetical protein